MLKKSKQKYKNAAPRWAERLTEFRSKLQMSTKSLGAILNASGHQGRRQKEVQGQGDFSAMAFVSDAKKFPRG